MKKLLFFFAAWLVLYAGNSWACNTTYAYINQTSCVNSFVSFNNQQLNTSGVYKDTLVNYTGCDSIITLTLVVSAVFPNPQTIAASNTYACTGTPLNFIINEKDTTTTIPPIACTGISGGKIGLSGLGFNGIGLGFNHQTGPTYALTANPGNLSVTNITAGVSYFIYESIDTSYLHPQGAKVLMWIDYDHSGTFDATELLQLSSGTNFTYTNFTLPATALSGATVMRIRTVDVSETNYASCATYTSGSTDDIKIYISGSNSSYQLVQVGGTAVASSGINSFASTIYASGLYYGQVSTSYGCSTNSDTLSINLLASSSTNLYDTICHGSYFFNYAYLNATGAYVQHFSNAVGCDSMVTLYLTSNIGFNYIYQPICHGGNFFFNNQTLTVPGTYYDTLTNYLGCDSLIILNLYVPTTYTYLYQTICAGSSFVFNGQTLLVSGSYLDTLPSYNLCGDSLLLLFLTVDNVLVANAGLDYSGCSTGGVQIGQGYAVSGGSGFYSFNWSPGVTLSDSTIAQPIASPTTTTTYTFKVTDNYGCTASDQLIFTPMSGGSSSSTQSICSNSNYYFNGQFLTANGVYYDTLVSYQGCDSLITLTLTVLPVSSSSFSQSICAGASYYFNGNFLNASGTYFDTLTNAAGCDSIISLNLIVRALPTPTFTALYRSCSQTNTCADVTYTGSAVNSWSWSFSFGTPSAAITANTVVCYSTSGTHTIHLTVTDAFGCSASTSDTVALSSACVWPGDADNNNVVDNTDIFPIGLLNGANGIARANASLMWIDQPATAWGALIPGTASDVKYADCNGDGAINGNDTVAIISNYSLAHAKLPSPPLTSGLVTLNLSPDTLYADSFATASIALGTASTPLDSIYGVAFTFHFNPLVVDTNLISVNIPASWLFNTPGDNFSVKKFYRTQGTIHIGLVRNDQVGKSGYGPICTVNMPIITDDIIGRPSEAFNRSYALNCTVDAITLLKLDGTTYTTTPSADSALILYYSSATINTVRANTNLQQTLQPNPATNSVLVELKGYSVSETKTLVVMDAIGRTVLSKPMIGNSMRLSIENWANGVYIIQVRSAKGINERKLIKQ